MTVKTLVGQQFGLLEVVALGPLRGRERLWLCRCLCGSEVSLPRSKLAAGKSRSCACKGNYVNRPKVCVPETTNEDTKPPDEAAKTGLELQDHERLTIPKRVKTGAKFGFVTITKMAGRLKGAPVWLCECRCGVTIPARQEALLGGRVMSCGCVSRREVCATMMVEHDNDYSEEEADLYVVLNSERGRTTRRVNPVRSCKIK